MWGLNIKHWLSYFLLLSLVVWILAEAGKIKPEHLRLKLYSLWAQNKLCLSIQTNPILLWWWAGTHTAGPVTDLFLLHHPEHGHADIPTFYTCDEGLSALTQEGHATLERLEGMLAHSVAQQYHMAGVRTAETNAEFEGLSQARLVFLHLTSVLITAATLSLQMKFLKFPIFIFLIRNFSQTIWLSFSSFSRWCYKSITAVLIRFCWWDVCCWQMVWRWTQQRWRPVSLRMRTWSTGKLNMKWKILLKHVWRWSDCDRCCVSCSRVSSCVMWLFL